MGWGGREGCFWFKRAPLRQAADRDAALCEVGPQKEVLLVPSVTPMPGFCQLMRRLTIAHTHIADGGIEADHA